MTTTQTSSNSKKNPAPSPEEQAARPVGSAPAGYEKVTSDKPQWKPKKVGQFPCHLELISLERMPDAEQVVVDPVTKEKKTVKKPWHVFNGILVEPGKFCGREDKIVEMGPGDEVMIPISGELKKVIYEKFCSQVDAGKVARLWIKADKEIEIGKGGERMWTYEAHFQPFAQMRDRLPTEPGFIGVNGARRTFAQLGAGSPAPAPAQGQGSTDFVGEVVDPDLDF